MSSATQLLFGSLQGLDYEFPPVQAVESYFNQVIGLYPFENSLSDESFYQNDVSLTSGTASYNTSKDGFNQALELDATVELNIPNQSKFSIGRDEFTMECLVYLNAGSLGANQHVLDRRGDTLPSAWLVQVKTGGILSFTFWNSNNSQINLDSASGLVSEETWHHIAISRDGAAIRVFLDGVKVIGRRESAADADILQDSVAPIYVGSTPSGSNALNGRIDAIRLTEYYGRYTDNFAAPITRFPAAQQTLFNEIFYRGGFQVATRFADGDWSGIAANFGPASFAVAEESANVFVLGIRNLAYEIYEVDIANESLVQFVSTVSDLGQPAGATVSGGYAYQVNSAAGSQPRGVYRKLLPSGSYTAFYTGSIGNEGYITADTDQNIYISDGPTIRKLNTSGTEVANVSASGTIEGFGWVNGELVVQPSVGHYEFYDKDLNFLRVEAFASAGGNTAITNDGLAVSLDGAKAVGIYPTDSELYPNTYQDSGP